MFMGATALTPGTSSRARASESVSVLAASPPPALMADWVPALPGEIIMSPAPNPSTCRVM
ncbi:hypothetical protein D3C78_1804840 [compost metagenome]